jgi:hypothetical protein
MDRVAIVAGLWFVCWIVLGYTVGTLLFAHWNRHRFLPRFIGRSRLALGNARASDRVDGRTASLVTGTQFPAERC